MPIRATLQVTKAATYAVCLSDPNLDGMPRPVGTGFFVSAAGAFVTAAHVVLRRSEDGKIVVRDGLDKANLMQPPEAGVVSAPKPGEGFPDAFFQKMCIGLEFVGADQGCDVAILKCDFDSNRERSHLKDREGFHYLQVSSRRLEEAEPVYAYGFPLGEAELLSKSKTQTIGIESHCPRVTSAIVAGMYERSKTVVTNMDPVEYVIDKALNYGNSGGPVVATVSGHVHALCARFQPVYIPQPGGRIQIMIPSLYGVVAGLQTERVLKALSNAGASIVDD